jgi:hypothetical protein
MAVIRLGGSFLVNLQDIEVHILMPKLIEVSLEIIVIAFDVKVFRCVLRIFCRMSVYLFMLSSG